MAVRVLLYYCSSFLLFLFVISLSLSYPSIAPCLHSLTRHGTSLTTIPIPQSIINQSIDTLLTLLITLQVPDVLKEVEDRLMLHLTEEEAESHFQSLIDSAINALMPQIVEMAHILAMKMK